MKRKNFLTALGLTVISPKILSAEFLEKIDNKEVSAKARQSGKSILFHDSIFGYVGVYWYAINIENNREVEYANTHEVHWREAEINAMTKVVVDAFLAWYKEEPRKLLFVKFVLFEQAHSGFADKKIVEEIVIKDISKVRNLKFNSVIQTKIKEK